MGTTPSRSRTFVAASSQYLETTSPPAQTVPCTLACFIKPTAIGVGQQLLTLETSSGNFQYFGLQLRDTGAIRGAADSFSATGLATTTAIATAGRWQHTAAVFTSSVSRAVYLNGTGKVSDTTNVTPTLIARFSVGRFYFNGSPSTYFGGNMSQVAVWTAALSDAEIAMLASGVSPLRIQRSSLVFYAPNGEDAVIGSVLTNGGPTASQADPADVTWTINSTDRTSLVRRYESSIDQTADGTPDTCTFMARGFTPTVGQSVSVVYHNDVLFAGEITDVELVQARASARAHYRCQCIDATFLLNRRLVLKQWTNTAVDTIVSEILSGFTSGFTTTNVQTGLAALDFYAVHDPVSSALQRLADAIGARWKVRPDKDLYFRTTSNLTAPVTINAANLLFRGLSHHDSGDQIRNRVYVNGAGSSVAAIVPVGGTVIPVSSSTFFSSSGGNLLIGAQRPAYTGISGGAAIGAPVGTWSLVTNHGGGGALPASTTFTYKITYQTPAGETIASAASGNVTTGAGFGSTWDVNVVFTPTAGTAPYNISGFTLYASDSTSAGAGPWHLMNFNMAGNVSEIGQLAAGGLGLQHLTVNDAGAQPPTASTAGNEEFMGSTTSGSTAIGATTITVIERGHFSSTGGLAIVTVNGNTFVITYTGKSSSYGTGTITGVPASGFGSVQFTIATGTPIQNVPALTGVTGVVYPILAGDQARISVQRDDTASQTAMAALEGGDGIHEFKIDDSTLETVDACSDRGDAELTLGSDAQEMASFLSQDQYSVPGASVTFSIGSLSSTIPIATVRLQWEPQRRNPQRQVSMTTQLHTLYQILGDLQRQAKR